MSAAFATAVARRLGLEYVECSTRKPREPQPETSNGGLGAPPGDSPLATQIHAARATIENSPEWLRPPGATDFAFPAQSAATNGSARSPADILQLAAQLWQRSSDAFAAQQVQ